jgi:hypothetical protein
MGGLTKSFFGEWPEQGGQHHNQVMAARVLSIGAIVSQETLS